MVVGVADEAESVESVVSNKLFNTDVEDATVSIVFELDGLVEVKLEARSAVLALSNEVSEDVSPGLVVEDPEEVSVDVPKADAPVASLKA